MIDAAESILHYRFQSADLLAVALTHASHADQRLHSNERLEFLGDAILGMVVCEELYRNFPRLLEGEMTKIKSTAVSRRTCAKIAGKLNLEELMDLGKGMMMQARLPSSLAAGVFESVIGAIYIDQGHAEAHAFVARLLDPVIHDAAESGHQQNYKSVLQQHAQARFSDTPTYRVLDEKGPDHAKAFRIAVELAGTLHEPSWGQSKKQAEQQAALNALHALGVMTNDAAGQPKLTRGRDTTTALENNDIIAAASADASE
jgi:ribonuclease-3